MTEVSVDMNLVAYWGLYCGACGSYLKGRRSGCRENVKAGWCPQRKGYAEHQYATCADCKEFADAKDCGPRLYRELADWYPLLTSVGDYAEEAAFYRRLFVTHCRRSPRTLLDLGSGAGFEPRAVPFEHSSYNNPGHEVFLGLRPVAGEEE